MTAEVSLRLRFEPTIFQAEEILRAAKQLGIPEDAVAALHYGKRLLQFLDDLEDNDQTENNQILR